MNAQDRVERLRRIKLLADLDREFLDRVARLATELDVPVGHVLIEANQPGSGLFLIEEGTVSVQARGGVRRQLGPGDVVGELALLTPNGTRNARVRAETPVRCLAISRADFAELLESEPRLAIALLEIVARRLA